MKAPKAFRRFAVLWVLLAAGLMSGVLALPGGGEKQDKWALTAPNGLTFGFIKDYESYAFISAHYRSDLQEMHLIFGNSKAMAGYAEGAGNDGKPFPESATLVKVGYALSSNPSFPASIEPDALRRVEYITRDSLRFKDTGSWGYARFLRDPATDTFSPFGKDASFAKECFACHTIVAAKDFIFTRLTGR